MPSSATEKGFKIGIEMEVLLSPKGRSSETFKDLSEFADFLVEHCNAARKPAPKVHNDVDGVYGGSQAKFEWSLTDDGSVKPSKVHQWPLELVSPILNYDARSPWREEVRTMFNTIRRACIIESNQTCGVHVHISPPGDSRWSLPTLKSVCRSILYFDGAIEAMVPECRRRNQYTLNNRRGNGIFIGKDISGCLRLVEKCKHPVEVADLMNEGGKRYFAWNFTNLYYGGLATIEFRMAPGASDETMCLPWVEFVVCFAHASKTTSSYRDLLQYSRDVQGLRRFLLSHEVSGLNRTILDHIFKGKSGYIVPQASQELTEAQRAELETRMQELGRRNCMMKKFGYQL
ncbi:amidoligase enzyme-domain-containing protein [Penicillium pulvis]|uniref:amidoligase enzyme-domain-containing protein n=1 Tax=Penicillium pulvis TaxID=1562058 RepID=UPI002549AA90|nr:amidoligase enzyme-domain-containing protein [Penicillium pulvis]KAJ5797702.1 amidoligase enzyme-domain-containing protein [Penicillium pulvis]